MQLLVILQFITIALSPLYIIRWKIPLSLFGHQLLIPTTLLEVLLLITVGVTLYQFITQRCPWEKIRTSFDWFIMLFILISVIETVVSVNKVGGIGILKAYIIEPILFYYSIVFVGRSKGVTHIMSGLLSAACWLSILSLLQLINPHFSLAPNEIAQHRISGVYNSANALALFLGPVILLTLSTIIVSSKSKKFLLLALCFIFVLVMLLTKSKGGIVALLGACSLFGYTFLAIKNQFLRKIWWILPIGFLLFSATFFVYVDGKYHNFLMTPQVVERTQDTLEIRYFLWSGTLRMLSAHPLFGAGLDGFQRLYGSYRYGYAELLPYPHNIILNFWSELGFTGVIAFIFFLIFLLRHLIRRVYSHIAFHQKLLGIGLIAGIVYWIIHGMVDVPYFKNDLSVEFWVLVALSVLIDYHFKMEKES